MQAAGGLNLLGLHQLKKDEEKARMQREYREMLDYQAQAKKQLNEDPIAMQARRKHLSDQVFSEIVNKAPENHGIVLPVY